MSLSKIFKEGFREINPGAVDCAPERCRKALRSISKICLERKWVSGTPFMLENRDGSVCYCRCSTSYFTTDTVIHGEPIEQIHAGDTIYACDEKLQWQQVKVDYCDPVATGFDGGG